jgi:hypothetical protein
VLTGGRSLQYCHFCTPASALQSSQAAGVRGAGTGTLHHRYTPEMVVPECSTECRMRAGAKAPSIARILHTGAPVPHSCSPRMQNAKSRLHSASQLHRGSTASCGSRVKAPAGESIPLVGWAALASEPMDSVYWPLEPSRTSRLYRPDWNLSYNGMKMQANARRLWGELVVYMGNGNPGLSRRRAKIIQL